MVRINNSFDGFSSSRVLDGYIRNLHDYRVEIEVTSLSIINFLMSRNQNPAIIPCSSFEGIKKFIIYLSHIYHKRLVEFICVDDPSSPIYKYRQELDLISKLIFESRKNYAYCLNDVIDFYLDNGFSLRDLLMPRNLIYTTNKVRNEYHKYIPKGFEQIITEYQKLETDKVPFDGRYIQDLFKNPQNLYLRLLEEIVERGIDYLLLQFYDFLVEETNQIEKPLVIKSNKLIQIWDDLNFVSQSQKCKPSLDNKISFQSLKKNKIKNKEEMFDYVLEEWASNLNRAIDLKTKLGIDFIHYLNTTTDIKFLENYNNHVYPVLNGLVEFVERKLGTKLDTKISQRVSL